LDLIVSYSLPVFFGLTPVAMVVYSSVKLVKGESKGKPLSRAIVICSSAGILILSWTIYRQDTD